MQQTIPRYIFYISLCFLLLTIAKSFHLVSFYGGCDLRCRTVNARPLATNKSPYFYKWQKQDGEYYLDPGDTVSRIINGNVVTPAVLYTLYPLAVLPYLKVRFIWAFLEILFGLSSILLILWNQKRPGWYVSFSVIVLGIVCTETWLLEIERGQMYFFYTFLFSLMYSVYISRWKYNEFISGLIGGFFILFRPFAAATGIAFLVRKKMKWIAGCITGFILACMLFILPRPAIWVDYIKAMKEYTNVGMLHPTASSPTIAPQKPAMVEGMKNLLLVKPSGANHLNTVYHYLSKAGIQITNRQSIVLYLIVAAILGFIFLLKKDSSPDAIFLFGFILFFLAEIFAVTPRAEYNMLQWIFPLTVILKNGKIKTGLFLILITALLLLHNFPFVFPHQVEIAELVFLGITFACAYFPGVLNPIYKPGAANL